MRRAFHAGEIGGRERTIVPVGRCRGVDLFCVIARSGLGVLAVVFILLMPCCAARGDQPRTTVALGVDHDQDHTFLGHPGADKPLLAVVFPVIEPLDPKGIAKDLLSQLEVDAVFGVVFLGLRVVSFKGVADHRGYGLPVVGWHVQ